MQHSERLNQIAHKLVKGFTGEKFEKPKLEIKYFKNYSHSNSKPRKKISPLEMRYLTDSNTTRMYLHKYKLPFQGQELFFHIHENTHAAQFSVNSKIFTGESNSTIEQTLVNELFYEGNADYVAISLCKNRFDLSAFACSEMEKKYEDLDKLYQRTNSKNNCELADALHLLSGDKELLKNSNSTLKLGKYALGYFFTQKYHLRGFESLVKNPPKTFQELLTDGTYKY